MGLKPIEILRLRNVSFVEGLTAEELLGEPALALEVAVEMRLDLPRHATAGLEVALADLHGLTIGDAIEAGDGYTIDVTDDVEGVSRGHGIEPANAEVALPAVVAVMPIGDRGGELGVFADEYACSVTRGICAQDDDLLVITSEASFV